MTAKRRQFVCGRIAKKQGESMEIKIRNAGPADYEAVEKILQQVQRLHIGWRPDIYRPCETMLPPELYEQAVRNGVCFVAEYGGKVAGAMRVEYRHIANPVQATRDVIYIDSMGVEESCRGKGIGHAFFEFLKALKEQKGFDAIELQVNAKNEAARGVYADCGFMEKSITMELA